MKKITFSIAWPFSAVEVRELLTFTFQVSLVSFLGLFVAESLRAGFVSHFFNVNIFLWFAVGFGILSTIWPAITVEAHGKQHTRKQDLFWIILFSIASGLLIWHKIGSVEWVSKLITVLSSLVVLGLCLLVYFGKEE